MSNLERYNDRLINNKPEVSAHLNKRLELFWQAGRRGKPGINGDFVSATEATNTVADRDFEVLGTNAASALSTFNAEGGVTLTTATGGNDQMVLAPHLDANQSAWTKYTWGTDRETHWECLFDTGASISSATIWAGLKLTYERDVATDADQVFVRYDDATNSGKFQIVYSIGGTDVTVDSGLTAVVSTRYHVSIHIDRNRVATVRLTDVTNQSHVAVKTTALTTAVDLIPYLGIEDTSAGAAKAITVYGEYISRLYGA
jgi:hypothetical protein